MEINCEEKKKIKKHNAILLVLDIILVIVAIYFAFGYLNFYKLTNEDKPLFSIKERTYKTVDGNVKVNDYLIYKIVRHEVTNDNVSYSLKLWFMKDIKE